MRTPAPASQEMPPPVLYFHQPAVGDFHYGGSHPMKPHRLALTHALVLAYGLHKRLDLRLPLPASSGQLAVYHSAAYVQALMQGDCADSSQAAWGDDCPRFAGMQAFCSLYAGASLSAAEALVSGAGGSSGDIAINWSGGLHHAKRAEPSGFCYANDIVLAILRLLTVFPRVLYVDIDVHHGDGVQEAFYGSDRVLTLSIHKYGDGFFPGTGAADEVGCQRGRLYSVNCPLRNGIDDASYAFCYRMVLQQAVDRFQPACIVLQCGADSLAGDRLGTFNLSVAGHGDCVAFAKAFGLPMLVLGGGGYTPANVARAWAYETGLLVGCGEQLAAAEVPEHCAFREAFGPDFLLHSQLSGARIPNANSRAYLEAVRSNAVEQLRLLEGAPSVQMAYVPGDSLPWHALTGQMPSK